MKKPSFWDLAAQTAAGIGENISQISVETTVKVTNTVNELTSQAGKTVTDATTSVSSAISNNFAQKSTIVTKAVSKMGSEVIAVAMNAIVDTCPVSVFLLPTGTGCRDFMVSFCFDEAIAQLRSGIFVRPTLKIWAGRADIDRSYLAHIIKNEFTRQLDAARKQQIEISQKNNTNVFKFFQSDDKLSQHNCLKRQQKQIEQKVNQKLQNVVSCLTFGLLSMFFIANPIFYIIFFSLAIFDGIEGITKAIDYLSLSQQVSEEANKLKIEKQKFEANFDCKNQAFLQAINNMEIEVHPVLQEVVFLFHELDRISFIGTDVKAQTIDYPWVNELLRQKEYRTQVSIEYHPLLDLIE